MVEYVGQFLSNVTEHSYMITNTYCIAIRSYIIIVDIIIICYD